MIAHLHRHSRWSLLDGSGSGDAYAARAAELGQSALALTDHGTLAGILEHISACQKNGIIPVCGVEAYFRDNRLWHVRENSKKYHLTLLAMNYRGWVNLQRMTSEAYQSGFYYKPCIDFDLLERYSEGVYCLGGCIGGRLSNLIQVGYEPDVVAYIHRMRNIFGENFSLEIMPHDFDDQRTLNLHTISVAYTHGIALAATGDAHYVKRDEASTQDVMLMLSTGQTNLKRRAKHDAGEDIYSMLKENPTLYLMSEEEMMMSFAQYHPSIPGDIIDTAINHTVEIIQKFEPFLLDRDIKMPAITRGIIEKIDPEGSLYRSVPLEVRFGDATVREKWYNEVDMDLVKSVLRRWAYEGLEELKNLYPASHWQRYPVEQYQREIEIEFQTFDQIGDHVWRYMLMAGGEVRWARNNDVIVGPGRGSAAGSRVAYLIGITDLDPISYGLMFERFINVNRKGMPDIDIDFMPGVKGRDRVQAHTGSVYGDSNVIPIATYAKYGPKAALRAVCRVFDDVIDYSTADRYAKVLDALKAVDRLDLEECAERFPQIREFKQRYPKLWLEATRIEGQPFTKSEHASGVLVKPGHIEIPTEIRVDRDTGRKHTVTAWPDTSELLASYGFLKLDYLVINGLIRQHEILRALADRENTPIDLRRLPVRWDPMATDPEVMRLFSQGLTLGVWQFEGKGTIPLLKSIKPSNMHDLAAINALIRPGPRGSGMTDEFAKRKNGEIPITYWHESVEPVLRNTYGLMIYQEQMMEIAVQLGDFTRTEADDLRKAMGKKYRDGLPAVQRYLDDLGYGIKFKHNAAKKVGEEMAIIIWDDKCLRFGEYSFNASHAYAYALISYHDGLLKFVSPADFYAWLLTFTKSRDLSSKLSASVREGSQLGSIKILPPDINRSGMGFNVIDRHTILYGLESVKGLGPAGAKEVFEKRPFANYQDFDARVARRFVKRPTKEALIGSGAFDEFGLRNGIEERIRRGYEKAYIGISLSGASSIDKYSALIEDTINTEEEFDNAPSGQHLCVGGEITGVKRTRTKAKGEEMGFVNLAYGANSYRVTVFAPQWRLYSQMFQEGEIIFFEGYKDINEKYGPGFIAMDAITLDELVVSRTTAASNQNLIQMQNLKSESRQSDLSAWTS